MSNTKLFTKTHHTLLYTLFISIINKKLLTRFIIFFLLSRYSIKIADI